MQKRQNSLAIALALGFGALIGLIMGFLYEPSKEENALTGLRERLERGLERVRGKL